jgi:hypothetical protein
MSPVVSAILAFIASLFRSRASLRLEHLARRHQLAVYKQTVSRPQLPPTDHLFWPWPSREIMAVAHAIVVSAFHMLSRHEPYRELGANYFDEQRRHHLVNHLTRRIERLGYHVQLEPVQSA